MFVVPINVEALGSMLSLGVAPKNDFTTGDQKLNKAGLPQWSVTAFVQRDREAIVVTVASVQQPVVAPDGQPITFVGLEAGTYGTAKGASFYWVAQSVKAVQRVSAA